jgi:hypothetical protein
MNHSTFTTNLSRPSLNHTLNNHVLLLELIVPELQAMNISNRHARIYCTIHFAGLVDNLMLYKATDAIAIYSIRTRGRSRIGREFRRDNRKVRAARGGNWAEQNGRGHNIVT